VPNKGILAIGGVRGGAVADEARMVVLL
jgi:hypothetical protein